VERELQDATERKEHRFAEEALRDSEARFRTLIEQSPLAIGISREGITVYGNQAYLDLFKIPSNEFIYGRSVIEQIAPQSREAILEKIKKRKEGLFTETTYEAIGLRTDGTQFPFHCAVTQVNLSEGMATLAFFTDITEQKLAEEATKAYQEQLKVFAAHLQSIREEERIAISRELHDNLGQCLTALKIDTSRIIKKLNKPDEVPDITTAVSIARAMVPLIDSTIELVRKITSDLRPRVLDEVGLVPAIEWQLEEFSKRTGIECKFHSELPDIKLDPAHSVGVFRIFQEAITNIMRHANASAVNVTIMQKGLSFILEIEDNGCGIKKSSLTDQQSLGLLGMKERAILFGGEVFIIGKKGSGTKVTLLIPVKNQSIHKSS
jgi:PAS domain S-box-containing protein